MPQIQNEHITTIFNKCFPHFDKSAFGPQTSFRSSGIDSLDLANFFLAVEETYTIKIKDEEFDRLDNISDTCSLVAQKVQNKQ